MEALKRLLVHMPERFIIGVRMILSMVNSRPFGKEALREFL
jgi:hypothetical protein